jgi:uncharacterized protein YjbI with pentapeptide repeats
MSNADHLAVISRGVDSWNRWRREHAETQPQLSEADLTGVYHLDGADLSGADLSAANLSGADLKSADLTRAALSGANLMGADLRRANFIEADLRRGNLSRALLDGADLFNADLRGADLSRADLSRANLSRADLGQAKLIEADLTRVSLTWAKLMGADLRQAKLMGAGLFKADLRQAKLMGAGLRDADLSQADFGWADLSEADLTGARLVEANFENACLNGCRIYGISAWNMRLNQETKQADLIITQPDEATVKVDDIQVAQFIYLLLKYENFRNVLNSVTKRGVLILGRFGGGGLEVLHALGESLRQSNYLPMIFDFARPENRTYTETVRTLAGLARFVVVDLSGPSVPQELYATVPHLKIPFVPILEKGRQPYPMFVDLLEYEWVLKPIVEFDSISTLIKELPDKIVSPAEKRIETRQAKLKELFG